jgi:hypothetical protein
MAGLVFVWQGPAMVCRSDRLPTALMATALMATALMATALLVVGCPAAQVRVPTPRPTLAGAWQSNCFTVVNADDTEGSARIVVGVTHSLWALDRHLFADDACTAPTGTIHVDGGYELEAPSPTTPGAWNVRFDFRSRTITPQVDGFIAYMESLSCGDSFGVDRSTDVLDTACPALGFRAFGDCQAEHDMVAVDGDTLRFGMRPADGDLCEPPRRPTALGIALERIR